jgi:FkbM family methyltransferase
MNRRLKEGIRTFLPRSIRDRRILGGPLRGQYLVTSWHDYPGAILGQTEKPLLEWFRRNVQPGETWLDIGAHYGYTAVALSRLVGEKGRVYAFEPMVATAGCVSRTREKNRLRQLTVVPVGLGSCDKLEIQRLPVVRGMADSTLADGSFEEPLLVAGLDWLWPQIGQSNAGGDPGIDGVKIDVQGMEIQVLTGMRGILQRYRPKLAIEIHQGVSRRNFLELLGEVGYAPPGHPIEPLPGESDPQYADNRSYAFSPAV